MTGHWSSIASLFVSVAFLAGCWLVLVDLLRRFRVKK